ncbi:hypothetical protein HY933_00480 [Candidatus Falkowbacteria bacterium]|nr:hypothetical protein [Candidatus Falkowbacteria bacterium]
MIVTCAFCHREIYRDSQVDGSGKSDTISHTYCNLCSVLYEATDIDDKPYDSDLIRQSLELALQTIEAMPEGADKAGRKKLWLEDQEKFGREGLVYFEIYLKAQEAKSEAAAEQSGPEGGRGMKPR